MATIRSNLGHLHLQAEGERDMSKKCRVNKTTEELLITKKKQASALIERRLA
jgi:hypothetical protein